MQYGPIDVMISGGTVVNADWSGPATVCIAAERVTHVVQPGAPLPEAGPRTRLIDAEGLLVIPGGVDPHTHIDMEIGAWRTRDDYAAATTAALWGGTTTVVDFAIPRPGQTPLDAVRERQAAAATGHCDAALHGCVVDWTDDTRSQLEEMAALGVRTVKLFTTYRDVVMAEADTVLKVMEALSELGGLAVVHAEANHLIEANETRMAHAQAIDAAHHADTRSVVAEVSAVEEVVAIAEYLDVPVYFVHQSDAAAVDVVRAARRRGVRAYTETCPHYLALDSSVYAGPHPERFVCCPPIRPVAAVRRLRQAALAHDVDTVGSDHCCYSTQQKLEARHDVRLMPAGLPGVETRLPVTFTTLVAEAGMSVERFVALVSANPARLNGLYPAKGVIAPGSDADVVLLDPRTERVVDSRELHMQTDYSPYEGRRLTGWPVTVLSRGEVVVDHGVARLGAARGRALRAASISTHELVC